VTRSGPPLNKYGRFKAATWHSAQASRGGLGRVLFCPATRPGMGLEGGLGRVLFCPATRPGMGLEGGLGRMLFCPTSGPGVGLRGED